MPDILKITRAGMRALVESYGCYDAVAALITARFGLPASKGTISKKMAGHNEFTLPEIIALEDAAGEYPVTHALMRRLNDAPVRVDGCLVTHGANIAKETGEAVSAILAAQTSARAEERADAIQEIDEAMHALRTARAHLENHAAKD